MGEVWAPSMELVRFEIRGGDWIEDDLRAGMFGGLAIGDEGDLADTYDEVRDVDGDVGWLLNAE